MMYRDKDGYYLYQRLPRESMQKGEGKKKRIWQK